MNDDTAIDHQPFDSISYSFIHYFCQFSKKPVQRQAFKMCIRDRAKDFHEDVRDVIHKVHGVIPADDVVGRCQIIIRPGFPFDDGLWDCDGFRD